MIITLIFLQTTAARKKTQATFWSSSQWPEPLKAVRKKAAMNWRDTKVSLGEYLIVCCWCSGVCLRDNNSNYRLEGSKGRKAADVWCGAWGVGGVHWEEQKWGRAWFEMGWCGGSGFRSMADSPHIELGIGLGFLVSAFLLGPNFDLYKGFFIE